MKLPLKFLEKKEPSEYYLALILRNEKAASVIFEKQGKSIRYISSAEELFENTIEDASGEEFVNVLDKVISEAEEALPDNIETHKTILGLKENWVEDNKIKKEYLEKLKKASDELSLNPIGFLIFSESVISLIHKEEGAPVTTILCDIGNKYLTVSLVKAGKILETRSSEIHESAAYTVDTLLKHFQTPGNLPPRIILIDSEEEGLEQEFIGYSWSKSLSFLHFPQIANLEKDTAVKAMLLGAATQMGTTLIYDKSVDEFQPKEEEFKPEENPEPAETAENQFLEDSKTPLDFVPRESSLEYFGFVEEGDIAKTPLPKIPEKQDKMPADIINENFEEIPEQTKDEEERQTPLPVNASFVTAKIKKFIPLLFGALKKIKINKNFLAGLTKGPTGNKKIIAVGVFVILIVVLALFLYLFARKATVTITVSPKIEEKTASVTFSPSSSTDVKNNIIAVQNITVTENGTATTQATGTKDVGTQAKGTVTIFNISSSPVTLDQGTTITSSNNLDFTLDSSVSVASASGDAISGINPSTANVNVTASDIGTDYNLPSGTKFTIGNNPSIAAKNDNPFSGGTKKQETVVSKDDLAKLMTLLPKQLEDKAKTDITAKLSAGQTALPQFTDESVTSPSFDKKEGDQASQVTLTAGVDFSTVAYNYSDISDFAKKLFSSNDTELNQSSLNIQANNIKIQNNNDITSDLDIKAKILPKIDTSSLAGQIAGQSKFKAVNILSALPQVQNVGIVISPPIPFLPDNLPGNPKSITILIQSQ